MVRDQEFLVTGDANGAIWVWEVNYDSLKGIGALGTAAAIDGSEQLGEVTAVLFSEAPYLSRTGEEFAVAGHASGSIRVRIARLPHGDDGFNSTIHFLIMTLV